ncbi:30S ribosomal protein S6, partial [Patescibacteria group bacterium]|nr:30S ribosomal protein S6 [Patescibacteria group bacterium]
MKIYELVYLISPELETEEAGELASEISAFLQKEGGSILKAENPSPRTLSYQIKAQGAAFQVNMEFTLDPEKLRVLEDKIRKNTKILRYMLIIKKPPRKEPTARKMRPVGAEKAETPNEVKNKKTEKKVELKDIEEKL